VQLGPKKHITHGLGHEKYRRTGLEATRNGEKVLKPSSRSRGRKAKRYEWQGCGPQDVGTSQERGVGLEEETPLKKRSERRRGKAGKKPKRDQAD